MKKQLLLSLTVMISLAAVAPVMSYNKSSDNAQECSKKDKSVKQDKQQKEHRKVDQEEKSRNDKYESGKAEMHKAERELANIEKQYNKKKNKEAANEQIEKVKCTIEKSVAAMKHSKEHSAMAKRHEQRLNNELARVKKMINQ